MSRIRKRYALAGLVAAGALVAAPSVAAAADGDETSRAKASTTAVEGDEQQRTEPRADTLALEFGDAADKATIKLGETREELRPAEPGMRASAEAQATPANSFAAPTSQKLTSAEDLQSTFAERLTRAVEDGILTQEQADVITEAVAAGVLSGPDGHVVPRG